MLKYNFIAVISLVVCLSLSAHAATYGGGSGTAEDPYQIWTAADVNTIGANSGDWGKCFKLMADIDMSNYTARQYKFIGNYSKPFTGTFYGDYHKIRNLSFVSINYYYPKVGFFGYASNATIKNLRIENVAITTDQDVVGGLVGTAKDCIITNCCSTGSIISNNGWSVGGLVGQQISGMIANCFSSTSVSVIAPEGPQDVYAGGLVGSQEGTQESYAIITNCYSTSAVSCSSRVYANIGGLLGFQNNWYAKVEYCYAAGPVFGQAGVDINQYGLGSIRLEVLNCFFDMQSSGQTFGGHVDIIGKTTAEMKTRATFTSAGWDFGSAQFPKRAKWRICVEGATYPRLYWEGCDVSVAGCQNQPEHDSNGDCKVNFSDFAIFASEWLDCGLSGIACLQ